MSFAVILKCTCCDTELYHSSVTYNLTQYFKDAFDTDEGIRILDGKNAMEVRNLINKNISKLIKLANEESIVPDDRWTNCAANALKDLQTILSKSEDHFTASAKWVVF